MLKVFSLRNVQAIFVRFLLFAMILALAGVQAVRTVKASDPMAIPPCFDIVGQGKQVLVGGVANSGVVNFDPISGNPLYQYEACAVDPDGDPTVGNFELRGWAWDTNLGWISFYCPPGVGATNLGIACSNASYTGGYKVEINPVTGNFTGYAWGDNVGWISFENPGFSQVKVDATNPGCQGYVYSDVLPLPDPACPNTHTKADTAAWSDNVGWLDFDGILLPWYSLTVEIDDTTLWVTLETDGGLDPSEIDLTNAPLANGTDKYTLRLHVEDKKGNPVDPGGRYTVTATPEWTIDTVKKDQTHSGSPLGAPCDSDAQHAVSKPCVSGDMVSTGSGNYDDTVTSVGPTSNMNGWDSDSDGDIDFAYEGFTLPSTLAASPVQSNQAILQDVLISIVDNDAGGACVYGIGGACAGKPRVPTYAGTGSPDLKFKPRTNVSTLLGPPDSDHPAGNDEYIAISAGSPLTFPTTITGPGSVTFNAGIDPVASPDYGFQFDTDADGILTYPPGDGTTVLASSATTSLSAGVGVTPETPVPAYVPGLYMYSVADDGAGVKYYSNKLPKTLGSIAVTPVAVLRGNVYSAGATTTTTSVQAIRSLGDVSTNVLRDTIFRNVSRIIAGIAKPASNQIVLVPDGDNEGFEQTTSGNLATLLPDDLAVPKVFYHYGDLVIDGSPSGSTVTWTRERTVIVIGGNIYINADLYNDPASFVGMQKPKLGLIALKDLTSGSAQAKQGHIYIDPEVTNIQANIFADGSVFSAPVSPAVTPPVAVTATGEPVFAATVVDQETALKYSQLFIEGSLASQNTVGGSTLAQPIIGTGEVASATDKLLQSRMYDLNYLRYYTGVIKRNAGGVPIRGDGYVPSSESEIVLTDVTGKPWTAYDPSPGYLYSPVTEGLSGYQSAAGLDPKFDLGATYIFFDPPTPTLPGFSSEASGTQRQLPQ